MNWYAITTDPAKVRIVRKRLRRAGHTAYLPCMISKRIVPKGNTVRRRRRVLPLMGYIFVEAPEHEAMTALWLQQVLGTKDVRSYLPAPINQEAIDGLRGRVAEIIRENAAARHKQWLRTGAKAAIKTGALAGKSGTVQWVARKKAGLEAYLFGSRRVVEVPVADLEAA